MINNKQQQQPEQYLTSVWWTKMPAMPKDKTTAISLREKDSKLKDQLTTSIAVGCITTSSSVAHNISATVTTMATNNRFPQQQKNRSTCGCGEASADVVDSSYSRQNYSSLYEKPLPTEAPESSIEKTTVVSPKSLSCCRTKQNPSCGQIHTISTISTDNETAGTSNNNKVSVSATPQKKTPNDFIFGKYIGEGSFSIVYLAIDIQTKKEYAIKVCEKRHILREQKQEYIRREREVMHIMTNVPGFVNLSCTFQDNRSLYFVMTYAKNGDLLPYINKVGSFDVECTRHYAAELVLACEQMHRRNVVHRDLKPENILLDENMHTLIADFGSAKILTSDDGATTSTESLLGSYTTSISQSNMKIRKNVNEKSNDNESDDIESYEHNPQQHSYIRRRKGSFVGTAQYVSPEVLQNGPITPSADLWALGCIVYQMISGLPPFKGNNDYAIFKEILACDLEFPQGFNKNAEDLVRKLLKINPEDRLGSKDKKGRYESIRSHPFFDRIDFDAIRQKTPPTIYPYLPGVTKEDEYRSNYLVPENLQPGLDDKQLSRLLGMELGTAMSSKTMQEDMDNVQKNMKKNNFDISLKEKHQRLDQQKTDKWHLFTDNELILKKGYVNKRKGLFARKRMMLLTTGPRLIYIDPVQMIKKGEIPWSQELRVEAKNFKIFFVHTPNRTYYLEDPEGYALQWVSAIENMRKLTYKDQTASTQNSAPATLTIKTSSA